MLLYCYYLVCVTVFVADVFGETEWRVVVKTSEVDGSVTDGDVLVKIVGKGGRSSYIKLNEPGDTFHAGSENVYNVTTGNIGTPKRLKVKYDNRGDKPAWKLLKIELEKIGDTHNKYVFNCKCWLHRETGTKMIRLSKTPWIVKVLTSGDDDAGTEKVFIRFKGNDGESRAVKLDNQEDDNFSQGKMDQFFVLVENVGTPMAIRVKLKNSQSHNRFWHLNKIELRRTDNVENVYVFKCDCWISEEDGYKTLQLSNPVWRLKVVTSNVDRARSDGQVSVTIVGTEGNSQTTRLDNTNDNDFEQGAVDEFYVLTNSIGTPREIRVSHREAQDWHLDRIELDRTDNPDDKYIFKCDCWLYLNDEKTIPVMGYDCPEDWSFYKPEKKCLKSFSVRKNFRDARWACMDLDGDLVNIKDEAKNIFVGGVIRQLGDSGMDESWIGVSNKISGAYEDIKGNKLTYSPWFAGSPSGRSGTCAIIYYDYENPHSNSMHHLKWDVMSCSGWQNPFTCEKDPGT